MDYMRLEEMAGIIIIFWDKWAEICNHKLYLC